MTREEIIRLASLVGTDSKDAEANLLQAISAAMKAAKPEKIFDWEKGRIYTDEERHKYYRIGRNTAIDEYEANLNTFLGGGNG